MDVNGTHFHLLTTSQDWFSAASSPPVAPSTDDASDWDKVEYDAAMQNLILKRMAPVLPHVNGIHALEPESRRGSAVDRYGNWYWIANDRKRIYWQPSGEKKPLVYWDPAAPPRPAQAPAAGNNPFQTCEPLPPDPAQIAGLAVTTHHYLVVGNVTSGGVYVFDLRAGGPPLRLHPFAHAVFPDGESDPLMTPFDMAATHDGGVWILDRLHHCYWGLDRRFRPVIDPLLTPPPPPAEAPHFVPVEGAEPEQPAPPVPMPFFFAASDPISIEALADGSVLILDSPHADENAPEAPTGSIILHYRLSQPIAASTPLAGLEPETDDDDPTPQPPRPVLGHDFVYIPATPPADASNIVPAPLDGVLFVVDREGRQVIAFMLAQSSSPPPVWAPLFEYLPLHYFGGRAIVGNAVRIFYDVVGGDPSRDTGVRWTELQVIDQPRYEREATLLLRPPLPIDPASVEGAGDFQLGDSPIQAFDGQAPACVWHRVLLDGCIPPETIVEVWARAHDEPDLLESVTFQQQPTLYLRGSAGDGDTGSEIPYYRPFGSGPLPAPKGTWELLLQNITGRYAQIRLVLRGNGRVSPEIHALRIYYPRFSYPMKYLPRTYQDDPSSASFLERLLANMEGTITGIDGKIERAPMLFDARTAVPEALDWLAGWLGLVLDPLWATLQQRRLNDPGLLGQLTTGTSDCSGGPSGIAGVGSIAAAEITGWINAPDRRRLIIRMARILYQRRGTPDGILFALHLLLDPCLESTLTRLKQACTRPDESLLSQLRDAGLFLPTPTSSDADLEDLLYGLLVAPDRPTKIRIVERFLTRNGKALLAGDPTSQESPPLTPITPPDYTAIAAATAHRFSVLVPAGLSADEEAMIRRVVDLEKPAHTLFDVRRYWDLFRVGEARLGIDTTLGDESRFTPIILGRDYLDEGYLAAAPPDDARDRLISDRDRLGSLPPL